MKALIYRGPYDLIIQQVDVPRPADDEVLIKVSACGICGSDIHGYTGRTGRRTPGVIMGHEFTGVVEKTGKNVIHLAVGERVTVQPILYCGCCEPCHKGETNRCIQRECLGVMAVNGAMAEYICVCGRFIKRLPDSIEFVQGTVIEPLAVAYRAVNRLNVKDKSVLLVGAGPIGLLTLKMLVARGVGCVIVSDRSDHRLAVAQSMGAAIVVNAIRDDVVQAVRQATGGMGADVSIEAVGVGAAVDQALDCLKNAGQCVWVGNSTKIIEVDMQRVVTRELSIFGTYSYTDDDFDNAMSILASGEIMVNDIIDGLVTLEDTPNVFQSLARGADKPIKCVITFN